MTAIIETKRLILRHWKAEDFTPFATLNANKHVCEFFPKTLSKQESNALANKIIAHFDQHHFGLFAIERKDTNQFIGFTGVSIPDFDAPFMPAVEIGWRLAYQHWGQGYATEAAMAVRDYAFKTLGFNELVSFTVPANKASRKVMEKIGMTHDPKDDFYHPKLPKSYMLSQHVLYRISC